MPSTRAREPRTLLLLARVGVLVAALGWAAPAAAELAIFADGDFLKISDWRRVDDGRVELALPSGGLLVVSERRLARIVDDEITDEPPPEEPPPSFSLRFDPADAVPTVPYGETIYAAAERHGLAPDLVAAVVRAESAFRADAVSPKGARGLMQLMPATAERFGLAPHEVFEPEKNIDAGTRYLRWLADRFADDLPRVLAAYNAGEGTVDRYGGVPPYRETHGYLERILGHLGLDGGLDDGDP